MLQILTRILLAHGSSPGNGYTPINGDSPINSRIRPGQPHSASSPTAAAGGRRQRSLLQDLSGPARHLAGPAAAAALLAASLLPTAAVAGVTSLSKLFVFGDSLSDSGNGGLMTGGLYAPLPYYQNRASNGPVAVEYLWQSFNPGNNTFQPSLNGGTNYAVLGATTGTENNVAASNAVGTPLNTAFDNKGNAWQLNAFTTAAPSFQPETSLFVVWLFPNDIFFFRNTSSTPNSPTATGDTVGTYDGNQATVGGATYSSVPGLAVSNVLGTINTLAAAGARNFLILNSPDLGQTPAFRTTALAPLMTSLSQSFNSQLETGLASLSSSNLSLDIELYQLDDAFASMIASPGSYGLSNVTDACLTTSVCADPSTYLFWDTLHPTTRAHSLIAQAVYSQVLDPAPAPLPVLGGLAAMGWSRRLRRRLRQARQPQGLG